MLNPYDLADDITESLQAIPALVTLMGEDATRISTFKQAWPTVNSWMVALIERKPPSIMVLYRGTRNGAFGRIPSRAHDYSLLVLDGENADVAAIMTAIMDGVPSTGSGLKWQYEINSDVVMIQDPEWRLQTLALPPEIIRDYWEATLSLTEKFAA